MADAVAEITAPDRLRELVGRLERQEGFAEAVASLKAGHAATLDGVWGSSCALVAATLADPALGPLVVVCPRADEVDALVDDLGLFLGGEQGGDAQPSPPAPLHRRAERGAVVEQFPACEALAGERAARTRRPESGCGC